MNGAAHVHKDGTRDRELDGPIRIDVDLKTKADLRRIVQGTLSRRMEVKQDTQSGRIVHLARAKRAS